MKSRSKLPIVSRVGRATSRGVITAGSAVGNVLFLFGKGLVKGMQDALNKKEYNNER